MADTNKPASTWVTTAIFVIAALLFWANHRNAAQHRQTEAARNAAEQLGRDLQALDQFPQHRRLSEMMEAFHRANEAAPNLVEYFELSDDENLQGMAILLKTVRESPQWNEADFRELVADNLKRDPDFLQRFWSKSVK